MREAFPELGEDAPLVRGLDEVLRSGLPWVAQNFSLRLERGGHDVLVDSYFNLVAQPIDTRPPA